MNKTAAAKRELNAARKDALVRYQQTVAARGRYLESMFVSDANTAFRDRIVAEAKAALEKLQS